MAVPPEPSTRPTANTRASAEAGRQEKTLAECLAAEMAERWRRGERPPVEEFLDRHPELRQQPEDAAELIYEEVCARQELGDGTAATDVLGRFPQWREQLELLLRFHELLGPGPAAPTFPRTGEALGEFALLAELGRGARGRVFLASQPSLAGRLVVLKLTPCEGQEHVALARLQHTHIVPLYSAEDDAARNLRVLCMPYFGGATLARLLEGCADRPLSRRTGQHLLEVLDRSGPPAGASAPPPRGAARQYLARASYTEAVCWIGACLADALHYAHERGLVHLDVKPSNILLAADGQPMLLDFHLAREPVPAAGPPPEWVGGTAAYVSPEQRLAMEAVRAARPVPAPVDGRSDLYSLGVVLYEALTGKPPAAPPAPERRPAHVSAGLADILRRCVAPRPEDRYPTAADLAADLRRHLSDLPLRGVPNRSLTERWRKWRRRRPGALRLLTLGLAAVLAAAAVLLAILGYLGDQARHARDLLEEGRRYRAGGAHDAAVDRLQRGLTLARDVPLHEALARELEEQLALARSEKRRAEAEGLLRRGRREREGGDHARAVAAFEQARALVRGLPEHRGLDEEAADEARLTRRAAAAHELHEFVEGVRFLYGTDSLPAADVSRLEARCRGLWQQRDLLTDARASSPPSAPGQQVCGDLLDLALLWTDLRCRPRAGAAGRGAGGEPAVVAADLSACREALAILDEAERHCGPSRVLYLERRRHAEALGLDVLARAARRRAEELSPRTDWEYYALGRCLLRDGDLEGAAAALRQAVKLRPDGLWSHFSLGVCAHRRGDPQDAVACFSAAAALAPRPDQRARCLFNRALAYTSLADRSGKAPAPGAGDPLARALADYTWALDLDPRLGAAALNRGILRHRARQYAEATADLCLALDRGADPVLVHYNLALVHRATGDRRAALASARVVLQRDPDHPGARALLTELQR